MDISHIALAGPSGHKDQTAVNQYRNRGQKTSRPFHGDKYFTLVLLPWFNLYPG